MDGESNYESDISDSWSLIDINLNEEVVDVAEELDRPPGELRNVKLKSTDSIELNNLEHLNKKTEDACNNLSDLASASFVTNQDHVNMLNKEVYKGVQRISDVETISDSGDSESIEIIDVDGIDKDTDIERLDVSACDKNDFDDCTYHSDDEDSFCGESISNEHKSTNLTVIRKKRRKLSRHSESSKNCVNSKCTRPFQRNSNTRPFVVEEVTEESEAKLPNSSRRPVYKHYRNNVANTVLSLSMAVIFAGVACIAVGHFLGVQDASETVVELMEEIRKLQMESIALQSRLINLNKAFITQGANPKLELPPKEPQNRMPCVRSSKFESMKGRGTDANCWTNRFPPNSFQWLLKPQNVTNTKVSTLQKRSGYQEIDFEEFGRYIHDQLNFINAGILEGNRLKRLEESDKKISKELKTIMNRLSVTQNNIKNLYQRVVKVREKLRNKEKIFPKSVGKEGELKIQDSVAVRELDLNSIQWNPEKKDLLRGLSNSYPLYKFPQPKDYYNSESNSVSIIEGQSEVKTSEVEAKRENLREARNKKDWSSEEREKKKKRMKSYKERERKKEKRRSQKEKDKLKQKGKKERKMDKKQTKRLNLVVSKGINKSPQNTMEMRDMGKGRGDMLYDFVKPKFNETNYRGKKHSKEEDSTPKATNVKKNKKSRFHRASLKSQEKGDNPKKNKNNWLCSGVSVLSRDPRCFNQTGYWIFKWADGREEFRRHQSLSDWQFERAKKRKELRDEDEETWQFKRAERRKELRDEDEENWQFRRSSAREGSRYDHRWQHENHRGDYNGKSFIHEDISWI